MSSITKRISKTGKVSYRIRVFDGEDVNGKQKFVTKTWTPPEKMRPTTADSEARRVATLFEDEVTNRRVTAGGKTKFSDYARQVLATHECSVSTEEQYKYLMKRIDTHIGHLPLRDITQSRLRQFYSALRAEGQREKGSTALATGFKDARKACKLTQEQVSILSGLSVFTVAQADNGRPIALSSAEALCKAVGVKVGSVFTIENGSNRLSDSTVWHHHKLVRMILEVARVERIIPYNEAADMKNPPAMPSFEVAHLDDEQAQHFVLALEDEPDIRIKTALMLDIYTGIRRGELCGLSWPDIDEAANTIQIQRASQYQRGKGIVETSTKNKSSERTILVPEHVIGVLKDYKRWWLGHRLKWGADWQGHAQRLFIQDNGRPIYPSTVYNWLQAFLKRNGLPRVSLHSLRHTCLTLLLSTGADLKSVQQISGHTQASTLLNTYGHFLPSTQAPTINALDAVLSKKRKQA